jgi:hypothetical protein
MRAAYSVPLTCQSEAETGNIERYPDDDEIGHDQESSNRS